MNDGQLMNCLWHMEPSPKPFQRSKLEQLPNFTLESILSL